MDVLSVFFCKFRPFYPSYNDINLKTLFKQAYIKKRSVWLLLVGLAFNLNIRLVGQDVHFTQFYSNKLYLASAFAGVNTQNRIIVNYRTQWAGVNGYTTYATSYDHNFVKYNSGLGVLVMRDVAGDGNLGSLNAGLHYSYDVSVTPKIHIRPGVSLSYMQWGVDYSRLYLSTRISQQTLDILPPDGLTGVESISGVDASASALMYSKNILAGFNVDHLMRPSMSLLGNKERIPLKYAGFGVLTIYRQSKLIKPVDETVSIAVIVKGMKQFAQADLGAYWTKLPLIIGLWYRGIPIVNSDRGDSFAFITGVKVRKFSVGYSFDYPISNLELRKSTGAHEISLALEFAKQTNSRKRKMQRVPCPEF